MNNPESEAKYDKLIGDVMRAIFHQRASAPAFRAEMQDTITELIDNYLISLTQEELNNLANGDMPYGGLAIQGKSEQPSE